MGKREFISVYFSNGNSETRKKKDVTLAFKADDPLYYLCKDLGSKEIRNILGIFSYADLSARARKENRSLNNFIKNFLKIRLIKDNKVRIE